MMIQLLLLSLSMVILEAQHMDHGHHHADTKPDDELRPNEFFHHTQTPRPRALDYDYYGYTDYEQAVQTELFFHETESSSLENNEELTTLPWWAVEGSTSVTCTGNEWRCLDGHFCLPENSRCDGYIECMDMSDEKNCGSNSEFLDMDASSSGSLKLGSPIWIIAAILLLCL